MLRILKRVSPTRAPAKNDGSPEAPPVATTSPATTPSAKEGAAPAWNAFRGKLQGRLIEAQQSTPDGGSPMPALPQNKPTSH